MPKEKEQFNFTEPDLKPVDLPLQVKYTDLIDPYFTVSVVVQDTSAATAANYGVFFIAPFSCEIIEAWESHKTAGSDASAVTLDIEKLTTGQALDAGVSTLGGTFNLKGTANTPARQKATTTDLNRALKPVDRLALKDSGTLTAVAHVCVTVLLRVLQTTIDPTT